MARSCTRKCCQRVNAGRHPEAARPYLPKARALSTDTAHHRRDAEITALGHLLSARTGHRVASPSQHRSRRFVLAPRLISSTRDVGLNVPRPRSRVGVMEIRATTAAIIKRPDARQRLWNHL